jgi:ABC-type Fe3+-siderophore transport system permease subunit
LAAIASVIIFFTGSVIFFFGIIYLTDRAFGWEESWDGGGWSEDRVIYWEYVLAGVLFISSFGAGIAGGIAAAKALRYPLAIASSTMLLASAIILQWDFRSWSESQWGEIAFILVLAIMAVAFLVMSRPAFEEPPPTMGSGPPVYAKDNYGWSSIGDAAGPPTDPGPKGVGR